MKILSVVFASIVLGAALGVGMSWARFHDSPPLDLTPLALATTAPTKGVPKILVDSYYHDFGGVGNEMKVSHVFEITNLGDAPLTLKAGNTTCTRCTIAKLEKDRLLPGETTGVNVEYVATNSQPRFRQHAIIETNDPARPRVELTIMGMVTRRYDVVPSYLVLSRISAKGDKSAEIKVYDFLAHDVNVVKHEFMGKTTAEYFSAEVQPIPPEQLVAPKAKSGCRVLVTVKPGLPLGPFRQTIRLELKLAGVSANPVVEVPIEGIIDSDISIVGKDWNADAGTLEIGAVERSKGAKRKLFLVVRGPHRRETAITIGAVDPAWLKVSLGEPKELETRANGEGGVTQIPLEIAIPPGSPPVNRIGSEQDKYAEVILDTTHPDVKRIRMYLQFVVLQ
jgi:hypothetical protein